MTTALLSQICWNLKLGMSNHLPASREAKSALFWVSFILGLMAINLGVAALAIYMAVGDQSFRPMPDYSAQAVDWQSHKSLLQASERLGWTVQLSPSDRSQGIRLNVSDSKGNPVRGCTGTVQAYHFTRSAESRTVDIVERENEDGVYWAAIPIDREGRWQVSVDLSGPQQERFVADRSVEWSLP